jgi:hypothetical protein
MGEINLNSIAFNNLITREDLFSLVPQESIYSFYLNEDISSLGVYHSPLREDNIPSFALYFHKINRDILMFKDFATNDTGDVVVLVMKMFGLGYKDAIHKIAFDMKLSAFNVDSTKQVFSGITRLVEKTRVDLGIKTRPWMVKDRNYWSQFGIHRITLEKFNVYPISHIFYNDSAVKSSDLAYAYVETKDGRTSYKIYQPLELKIKKWINNADYSVHQGYTQLPKQGKLLIITKSLKDVMSIHDCIGVSAIGLQSESVTMKDSVMDEYKSRFEKVVCIFDNDPAGIKLSESFTEKYHIPHYFMPKIDGVKDFSDLVKAKGKDFAIEYFNNLKI